MNGEKSISEEIRANAGPRLTKRITTSRAKELRKKILSARAHRAQLADMRLNFWKREAGLMVEKLRDDLSPETRLRKSYALARWESIADSLEDDGVWPDPKGAE